MPERKMSPRQLRVFDALKALGGSATLQQISERIGWNINGLSQTMSRLGGGRVTYVEGKGAQARYKLASQ
jgi:hypothetical protein